MNSAIEINLTSVPQYHKDKPVSLHSDGSVESYIFDNTWRFTGTINTGVGKPIAVSFAKIDIKYRKGIQSTLAYFIDTHKQKDKTHPTIGQIQHWKQGLYLIAQCLKACNWGLMTDDNLFSEFKKSLRKIVIERVLSQTQINNLVTTLNRLNRLKLCQRFCTIEGLNVTSPKGVKQHIAMPANMYQQILSEAVSTVETYHPHRHEISRLMRRVQEIYQEEKHRTGCSSTPGQINDRTSKRVREIKHNIPNFKLTRDGTYITNILVPCAVVILAFSGVRVGELRNFSKNSYEERSGTSNIAISLLRGETTKAVNGIPKKEIWQTHPISRDALELAYECTEYLREAFKAEVNNKYNKNAITTDEYNRVIRALESAFLPTQPQHNSIKNYQSTATGSKRIFSYIQSLNIKATKEDVESFNLLNPTWYGELKVGCTLPKLSAHDFRRSFAVFFRRYGFGTSSTIKFQYKHSNINMSDYYGNNAQLQSMEDVLLDTDLIQLMHEEGVNLGVDIFDEIYNESEALSGAGGERITKDKFEKLSTGERTYMTRGEIERLVRSGTISVVKLPTGGYCMNASCSRVCGIGEFAAEIKPCEHQVITDKEAKKIHRQNLRLIKTFRALNTGDPMMNSILIATKQKIKRNEILIYQHGLEFQSFEDDVEGTIMTSGV